MKKLWNWLFGKRHISAGTKIVEVAVTFPYYEDIVGKFDVPVPMGLSEEEENKFINEYVDNKLYLLNGK